MKNISTNFRNLALLGLLALLAKDALAGGGGDPPPNPPPVINGFTAIPDQPILYIPPALTNQPVVFSYSASDTEGGPIQAGLEINGAAPFAITSGYSQEILVDSVVRLKVINELGRITWSDPVTIIPKHTPQIGTFTAIPMDPEIDMPPDSADEPVVFSFTAVDADNATLEYQIIFDGGTPIYGTFNRTDTVNITHTFTTVGTHTARLKISDGELLSAPMTIYINAIQGNVPPVIDPFYSTPFTLGELTELYWTATDKDGDILTITLSVDGGAPINVSGLSTYDHLFPGPGPHTATLTVSDGNWAPVVRTIDIPENNFAGAGSVRTANSPLTYPNRQPAAFTYTYFDMLNPAIKCEINWMDGLNPTIGNPTATNIELLPDCSGEIQHTFDYAGIYPVEFIVTTATGEIRSTYNQEVTWDIPPNGTVTGATVRTAIDPDNNPNREIATIDYDFSDAESDPINCEINWNDGINATTGLPTEPNIESLPTCSGSIQHTFDYAGTYAVTVTSNDDGGWGGITSVVYNQLVTSDLIPTGTISGHKVRTAINPDTYPYRETLTVDFNITDPEGDPIACVIDWKDGINATTGLPTEPNIEALPSCIEQVTHIYKYSGTYPITIIANDGGWGGVANIFYFQVVDDDIPPVANLTWVNNAEAIGQTGESILQAQGILYYTLSDAEGDPIGKIEDEWSNGCSLDWGDGTPIEVWNCSDFPEIGHQYPEADATYTITLTVDDEGWGGISANTLEVVVDVAPSGEILPVETIVFDGTSDLSNYLFCVVKGWESTDQTSTKILGYPKLPYTVDDIALTDVPPEAVFDGKSSWTWVKTYTCYYAAENTCDGIDLSNYTLIATYDYVKNDEGVLLSYTELYQMPEVCWDSTGTILTESLSCGEDITSVPQYTTVDIGGQLTQVVTGFLTTKRCYTGEEPTCN